jgi:hypothetical protein
MWSRRLSPSVGGCLEPLAAALAESVDTGVLDGEAGRAGEGDHQLLVGLREVASACLLGEVEIAEHGASDSHRHAEERLHRRVMRWKSVRRRMVPQILHPDRSRLADEQTQDAPSVWQGSDGSPILLADASGDELDQVALRTHDPESAIPCVRELCRGLDDSAQHVTQVEVR